MRIRFCIAIVTAWTTLNAANDVLAQTNAGGLAVTVNEDYFFVLEGQSELFGLGLNSPSGSLLPGPIEPFQFSLGANTEFQTTGVNLGTPLLVDGEIVLETRWNQLGEPDVTFEYVRPAETSKHGPFPVFQEAPPAFDGVRVSFDDDYRFVLNGTGQKINELIFFSNEAGLIPSVNGAPFSPLTAGDMSNDADSIRFSSDTFVTIDGAVAIDVGWNRDLGFRDVRYSYRDFETGEMQGPFSPLGSLYPPPPPDRNIVVTVSTDQNRMQLRGFGHELKSFELLSPSGSLIPGATAAPFESFVENTPTRVELATASRITLDGIVRLDVRYDASVAGEDVTFRYQQTGFPSPRGPIEVSGRYPPNPQRSPLSIRLDAEQNLQLRRGIGQRLTSITVSSEGGSLDVAEDLGPFEILSSNDTEVTLSVASGLPVFGNLELPIVWDETAVDLAYSYTLDGIEIPFGPKSLDNYPREFFLGDVLASFHSHSVLVLDGRGREIVGFEVMSPSGSLASLGNIGPFDRLEVQDPTHLSFVSDEPLSVGRFFELPIEWNGPGDLTFVWHTADGRALVSNVEYSNFSAPEPHASSLAFVFAALLPLVRSSRKRLLGKSQP